MTDIVRNDNELRSVRNTADIKERVRKVLNVRHPDAELCYIKVITYKDFTDERQYLVSCISVDVIKDRKPRNKKSLRMLKHTFVTIENVAVEGLPDKVDDSVKFLFTKDAILYNLTFPKFAKLQKDANLRKKLLNVFTVFFSEGNIKSIEDINTSSLLILEDIKTDGYVIAEPTKDFDDIHTKFIIRNLAYFHAVGIALIKKDPNVFEVDLKGINKDLEAHQQKIVSDSIKTITKLLQDNKKLNGYTEKFKSLVKKSRNFNINNTLYTTLIHNDFWKNNIYLKYRMRKGYPTVPRFVRFRNFQFCTQGPSVLDIVQFVFTSATRAIRSDFYSVSYMYYESLIKNLRYIQCDKSVIQEFTAERLREEFHTFAWLKLRSVISSILENSEGFDNEYIVNNINDVFYWFNRYGWL